MEEDHVLLRCGLLLQALDDEHAWAYRYCVLTVKDGERALLVFKSAAAQEPVRTVQLANDAAARTFDVGEAQRLGSGGIVLQATDSAPETFWRALDEREAYDWRRALQARLSFDDTDQEGAGDALMPDACHGGPLLVWEIGGRDTDVRWRRKFCELGAGRGGRLRLHACEPTDAQRWRDRDRCEVLAPLVAACLRPQPDAFATPGFEIALADGRRFSCCACDVLDDTIDAWLQILGPLCAQQKEAVVEDDVAVATDVVTYSRRASVAASVAGAAAAAAGVAGAGASLALGAGCVVGAGALATYSSAAVDTCRAVADYALAPRRSSSSVAFDDDVVETEVVDNSIVAEVDVDVRRARLLRSGGADDALPPTLKIDGDEESGEGRLLEQPVVVVVRHGDAAFSSAVIQRSSGLRSVKLRCAFKCASARQAISLEVRGACGADPTRGPLFGRRELSLFELAERDAEDELRRLRTRLRRAWGAAEEDEGSSEDDPLEHSKFHGHARPAARSSPTDGAWLALFKPGEEPRIDEEDVRDPFASGDADDASGLKRGAACALIDVKVTVTPTSSVGMLAFANPRLRLERDRPVRDTVPSPAVTLDLLRRIFAVATWCAEQSDRVTDLLYWHAPLQSLLVTIFATFVMIMCARDHCWVLPALAFWGTLLFFGVDRLTGAWILKRVAPGDGIRDRDCATLRVAALAVDGLDLDEAQQPYLRLRYVPACARSPLARRVGRAARDCIEGDDEVLDLARNACDAAITAASDACHPGRALRAVAVATARLEAAQKGTWRWDSLDPKPPHRRGKPSGRLSTSAPPRIGVRSRAAYEAERLMQWAGSVVSPAKAQSPVPEPVVPPPPPPPGSPRAPAGPEVPATPPPSKPPFFGAAPVLTAEAETAAAASTRFRASWRRRGEKAYARAWSVPVLRELRVSAGAGPAAAPRVVPWDRAAGRLRVELYAPEAFDAPDNIARDIHRRAFDGDDPAPDGAALLGVAEVPLSEVSMDDAAAFAWDGWVPLTPPGGGGAGPTPRVKLRCLLEPAPRAPALRSASLRRRARVEALEGELEVPPVEVAPAPTVPVAEDTNEVEDVGVLSRLRRARATAVESQNLLRDYVRLGEQCRGLLEWSRPGASLAVFAGLTLFLVIAARMRADYLGVLVVLATMAPGAVLSVERRAARAKRSARCRRAARKCCEAEIKCRREADNCEDADRAAVLTKAAVALSCAARAVAVADAHADATHGGAARREAPRPDPLIDPEEVTIWTRLRALLEAIPAEPELERVFVERRRAQEWRRARRACRARLGATWAGPLWRRSTSWRRHFACVRRGELQFWYSASHALAGVSPVLVVALDNARVVDALAGDDLPVLTLHAPLKSAPAEHREWRLAAAHCTDADALRRCVGREASGRGADPPERPASPALSTTSSTF